MLFPFLGVGLLILAHPQQATVGGAAQEHQPIAFVDVNVVPMDSERVIERQTVIVRDDKIVEIGPTSEVEVPSGVLVIDGRGKYLMPGLADMHVHPQPAGKSTLLTYVANGVTTIRHMYGDARSLEWREQIARGELLGPTMYVSASPFTTETPEEVVQLVDERVAAGYDFVKVYSGMSKAAYDSVFAAANRHGIRVVGHVSRSVGLQGAFSAGQVSIEHLYFGYIFELVPPDAPIQPNNVLSQALAWNYADVSEFSRVAAATRDAGVWVCPTVLRTQHQLLPTEQYLRFLTRPEWRYMPPQDANGALISGPLAARGRYWETSSEDDFRSAQEGVEVQKIFVKALHEAGVGLLLGTDVWTGGFAVHEELRNFVDAGLSPYEAIRTGTRNAAEFLNATDTFGTVAVGLRADLILVEANPLDNVAHVARRVGVMVRGRWLPEEELQQRLDSLAVFMDLWKLGAFFEREDNPKRAMAAYSSAEAFDSTLTVGHGPWNALCWTGSRTEHAAEVLPACERAVVLADGMWIRWARDSRGLARALTGDLPGAIEDFEAYVAATSNDERRSQRQGWIDALRRGENPFTPEVLRALPRK